MHYTYHKTLDIIKSGNIVLQAKAKIMVVRDIERDEIEFISKTLNCLPISHVDHMKPEKLAHASLVESESVRDTPADCKGRLQGCVRGHFLCAFLLYTAILFR